MRLSLGQAVGYLGISERTARRWIRDRGLPVHRADERLFVNPIELWEWAVEHGVPVSPELLEQARRAPEAVPPISTLLAVGGIHPDVRGATPARVLRAVVDRLPLPPAMDREFLAHAVAACEGNGLELAFCHGIPNPQYVGISILVHVQRAFSGAPVVFLRSVLHTVGFRALPDFAFV